VLLAQVIETNRRIRGCDFPTQSQDVIDKQKATNVERHGVPCLLQDGLSRFLAENHVDNSSQLPGHRDKVMMTSLERYGVDHPSKDASVREKNRAAHVEREEALRKCALTNVDRFGVDWFPQSSQFHHVVDWTAAAKKRHETMKRDGTYAHSRAEDGFYDALCTIFGSENIERNVVVDSHSIDIYVRHIDTYVQFDGVYWHGLDRPIEVIERSTCPRDRVILGTIKRDEKQRNTFEQLGFRLIRVTDKQFKAMTLDELRESVVGSNNQERKII
jgi:hypothetical protein